MLEIISQIRGACNEFEYRTGKQPVSIYLGRDEWRELRLAAHALYYTTKLQSPGPKFDGKQVYVVAEDSHFAVA